MIVSMTTVRTGLYRAFNILGRSKEPRLAGRVNTAKTKKMLSDSSI